MDYILDFLKERGPVILTAVIIVAVGLLLVKLTLNVVSRILERSKVGQTGHKFILTLLRVLLVALVAIIALSMLGVDMTSVVAMLSVAGLAVSLAVQNSLANVAGGLILLVTKPFLVGEYVDINGLSGTVTAINVLQTELVTYDNKAIVIPNGDVSAAKLTNFSRMEKRLVDLTVPISYDEDLDRVKPVLFGLITADSRILRDPAPAVRLKEFGASSVNLAVRMWVPTPDYWDVYFAMQENIKRAFDQNGIVIPFNQLDVHIRPSGEAGGQACGTDAS